VPQKHVAVALCDMISELSSVFAIPVDTSVGVNGIDIVNVTGADSNLCNDNDHMFKLHDSSV
jgi:hypothetical protein